jgi:hypothetical protein
MKQDESEELLCCLQLLTDAAERFVDRAPQSRRLEQDQRTLLAAITKAQLVLSLHRLAPPKEKSPRRQLEKPDAQKKPLPPLMRLV